MLGENFFLTKDRKIKGRKDRKKMKVIENGASQGKRDSAMK